MDRICFIFGHREVSMEAAQRCLGALSQAAQAGIHTFVMWPGGGLEELAAATLRIMKQTMPELRILCLTSTPDAPVPPGFDGCHCPEGMEAVPKRFEKSRCCQMMAQQCHYAVCCVPRKGKPLLLQSIVSRRNVPTIELSGASPLA